MQIKRFQLIHFFSEHLNKSFQFKRHMSHILLAWLSLGKTLELVPFKICQDLNTNIISCYNHRLHKKNVSIFTSANKNY